SSDYSENGKLVIDETKLKDAIKNNLEDVQALFTGSGTKEGVGLADKLEEIIDGAVGVNGSLREKAGITGTSSANENTLSRQIKSLNDQISKEKERLTNKESKYYSLFATMETSITNSNSQLDALFSMMSY
ncbi:MAG: flagellar filament capping protein FliD, partial [Treponema sp.]|nr:flagellar filament capping protein FliD [Treponema sp.]